MPSNTIEQSHNLQEVFYVGSYLVTFLFLVWLAIKRKYPLFAYGSKENYQLGLRLYVPIYFRGPRDRCPELK